jgi:hypothetical protein
MAEILPLIVPGPSTLASSVPKLLEFTSVWAATTEKIKLHKAAIPMDLNVLFIVFFNKKNPALDRVRVFENLFIVLQL